MVTEPTDPGQPTEPTEEAEPTEELDTPKPTADDDRFWSTSPHAPSTWRTNRW